MTLAAMVLRGAIQKPPFHEARKESGTAGQTQEAGPSRPPTAHGPISRRA